MKSLLFFLFIIGMFVTIYFIKPDEGFQNELVVPLAGPPVAQLPGNPAPFAPPSTTLPAPPPGQIASVGSKPYEDPAMQRASSKRILDVSTTLDGFLTHEAPAAAQQLGDPSIQLPLNTARSDSHRLHDELNVLRRNPGLESSLTTQDLNDIESNLGYLQRKWRLSANTVEGFDCGCKSWFTSSEGFQDPPKPAPAPTPEAAITINDLKDLSARISVEIARLNVSGTTDPMIQKRVDTLTQIKNTVNDLISAVETGAKKIEDVPLKKSDIDTFLPLMSNLNSPVPTILQSANPALKNLFQGYSGKNPIEANAMQQMFDKYADKIMENISWDFNITYMGNAEQRAIRSANDLAMATIAALDDSPEPWIYGPGAGAGAGAGASGATAGATAGPVGTAAAPVDMSGNVYPGFFQSVVEGTSSRESTIPSSFQWKTRATQICGQIAARGLKPSDFGCTDPASVNDGFSWRGNAKMVCSRLATMYDPGVPTACGCPDPSWPGWRS